MMPTKKEGTSSQADATGILSSSYSAVLQEIFQQTQTEIQARNRNHSSQYRNALSEQSRSEGGKFQPRVQDDTHRFEPMVDPVLSYISDILADDDDRVMSHPVLSCDEFVAYHVKATEMAALLKEDSPTLALKIEANNTLPPHSHSCCITDHNLVVAKLKPGGPFNAEPASHLATSLSSKHLRNMTPASLPDASNKPLVNTSNREENNPLETLNNWHSNPPAKLGSQDDIGVRLPVKDQRALRPRKESELIGKKIKGKRGRPPTDQNFVDINSMLLQLAQAAGVNNMKQALEILSKVKQLASPFGDGVQRLTYYFAEAMEARLSGTGWPLYLGLLRRRPSAAEVLRATYMYMASCPFVKAYHYYINQTILNAARGASKLHILELQVTGFQYPSLFQALASRPEGPPEVHLIAIGFPHYSMLPARPEAVLEGIQKTCSQLSEYAASCGVPFQYTVWTGSRNDLQMQEFVNPQRNPDEILVIISAYMLRYIMDDTLDSPAVRLKLLKQGQEINPNVYIQGVVTGSYSTPFFTRRFREALFHFETVFDMLNTCTQADHQNRVMFESEILGKAILNIVACESAQVVERVGKYKHWQAVTEEAGFKQLPLSKDILRNVQVMLNTWHREYTVAEDSEYLLMGWKGRMLYAMSAWKA